MTFAQIAERSISCNYMGVYVQIGTNVDSVA